MNPQSLTSDELESAIRRIDAQRAANLWRVTERVSPEEFAIWSEESAAAIDLDRRDRADLCLWMESEDQYRLFDVAHDNGERRAPVLQAMLRDSFGDILYPPDELATIKNALVRQLRACRRSRGVAP